MEQDQAPEQIPVPDITETQEEEAPEEEVAPTKSVKNFWERLDEVFTQNTQLRERMEELVDQFPSVGKVNGPYKSFLFQPERICISSNDDQNENIISNITDYSVAENGQVYSNGGHQIAETFSSFRIRLERPLIEVKSIQLLSAVIPNAIQNIPDNSTVFYYYRIPSLALSSLGEFDISANYNRGNIVYSTPNTSYFCCSANGTSGIAPGTDPVWIPCGNDGTRPNYFAITDNNMNAVFLNPTTAYPADYSNPNLNTTYNRTFTDYNDLVNALNVCAQTAGNCVGTAGAGTISFAYDETLNKIQMIPNTTDLAGGYSFFPAGYDDPNIVLFMEPGVGLGGLFENLIINFVRGYTLNLRLGFTWNGRYNDPFENNPYIPLSVNTVAQNLYWYLRPTDPYYAGVTFAQDRITANNYGDLVNTSCVRVYCDFIYASTQDSNNQQGLLSIVPVNASNLGVAFYQNNFNNPLTKIPKVITEVGIRLVNDQGFPYLLPNSAVVLLELALEYL